MTPHYPRLREYIRLLQKDFGAANVPAAFQADIAAGTAELGFKLVEIGMGMAHAGAEIGMGMVHDKMDQLASAGVNHVVSWLSGKKKR